MFLVFDFDGTLADTRIPFREAFHEAASTMNARPFRQQDEAYLQTLAASDVLREHGVRPEQFASFTGLLKKGMESRHSQISLFPGIADALEELGSLDKPIGLITSNSEFLVRSVLVKHIQLFRYLRFDVSMADKGNVLTEAESACSRFGRLHYVGDEIRDYRAAVDADVEFSAVSWGFNSEAALRKEGCCNFIRQPSEFVSIDSERISEQI